jgi:hypothetical protein
MIELSIVSILIRASSRTKERGDVYNDLLARGRGGAALCHVLLYSSAGGGCGNVSAGRMAKGTICPCKYSVFTPYIGWPRDNFALGFLELIIDLKNH